MISLFIPTRRVFLFLILVQSVSLYKLYALDDHPSNSLTNSLISPFDDDEVSQAVHIKSNGYNDMIFSRNNDENMDNYVPWLSYPSEVNHEKRSIFSSKSHSSKAVPQRRNYRPHFNPIVAAYKRCGELSTREERETCFKEAIQMLFVHKLRK